MTREYRRVDSQGHVKTEQEAHEAPREQNERPRQVDPNEVELAAMVLDEVRMHHRRLLGVGRRLRDAEAYHGRVRLAQERDAQRAGEAARRGYNDEDVLEPDRLCYEAACDGANGGPDERAQAVHCHGGRPVLLGEEVTDGAATASYWCAAKEAACYA